jgi:hypothetical protein
MRKNRLKSDKIDKINRDVEVPCVECGKKLKFHIGNENVIAGEGVIAVNFPAAVCPDCIDAVLSRVADPPGLICLKELNSILTQGFINNFKFVLQLSEAVKFFSSLFPENQFIMPGNGD